MSFSFFPRTIYQAKSKISGEIVVKEHFGQRKLYVQGVLQSGGIIKDIWQKPLKRISNFQLPISNVLILGLGGGTVVQIIRQYWPEAKITGIEIDPEIIKIGKKFFDLNELPHSKLCGILAESSFSYLLHPWSKLHGFRRGKNKFKNLKIINNDALEWVRIHFDYLNHRRKGTWEKPDLMIVDLYLGARFLKKAEGDEFFKYLKRLLSPEGVVIFNRLRQWGEEFPQFEKKIKKHFSLKEKIKISSNLFFFASI